MADGNIYERRAAKALDRLIETLEARITKKRAELDELEVDFARYKASRAALDSTEKAVVSEAPKKATTVQPHFREAVLSALRMGPMTMAQMEAALPGGRRRIGDALKPLLEDGEVASKRDESYQGSGRPPMIYTVVE